MYRNLEEAQNTRLDIVNRIQEIDLQLAERKAKAEWSNDAEYAAYQDWKNATMRSRGSLIRQLQRTKIWMQKQRLEEAKKRTFNRGGDGTLLSDLYTLTKSLVAAGADISDDEQRLLDDVAVHLSNH